MKTIEHWSDCSLHNQPAYQNTQCDCGTITLRSKLFSYAYRLFYNLCGGLGLLHLKPLSRLFRLK